MVKLRFGNNRGRDGVRVEVDRAGMDTMLDLFGEWILIFVECSNKILPIYNPRVSDRILRYKRSRKQIRYMQ